MARKVFNTFAPKPSDETPLPSRSPLAKGGAGAPRYMQSSVAASEDRSHEDIPVDQIQGSAIEDRIDLTEDIGSLMESIEANGQQIPITVRIVNQDRPYEIVAGRRRLEAIRRLGRPTIRGFVTRMSDEEAFVAQGIENSARLETSFIERARTAVLAAEAGFSQVRIADFLALKTSMVSMMSSIYTRVGEDLVKTIGPARGVGRRKWDKLAGLMDSEGLNGSDVIPLVDTSIASSAERFEALIDRLGQPHAPAPVSTQPPEIAKSRAPSTLRRRRHYGSALTSVQGRGKLVINAAETHEGFLDYVADRLEDLLKDFTDTQEDEK